MRRQQKHTIATIATRARPPMTPPTIAPTLGPPPLLLDAEPGVGVEEVGGRVVKGTNWPLVVLNIIKVPDPGK